MRSKLYGHASAQRQAKKLGSRPHSRAIYFFGDKQVAGFFVMKDLRHGTHPSVPDFKHSFSKRTESHVEAFTSWINRQVEEGEGQEMFDKHLCDAFSNGELLAALHHALYREKVPHIKRHAKHAAVCRANCEAVLRKFRKDERLHQSSEGYKLNPNINR